MKKKCTKCGQTKPLKDFYRNDRGKHGRYARYKLCHNAIMRLIKTEKRGGLAPRCVMTPEERKEKACKRAVLWNKNHPKERSETAKNTGLITWKSVKLTVEIGQRKILGVYKS